jgi:hypothetical protein
MFFVPPINLLSAVGFDADTDAWETAVTGNGGTVSGGRKIIVNDLIVSLKGDGIWAKLDRLWLFAAEDAASALTDLVATALATTSNSPTFNADLGYTGNGSNMSIDTGFNASTAGGLYGDDANWFVWSNTSAGDAGFGRIFGTSPDQTRCIPRGSDDTTYNRINTASQNVGSQSTGVGLYGQSHEFSSGETTLYKDGSTIAGPTNTGNGTLDNANFTFLTGGGVFSPNQCCGGGFGDYLDATESGNLYTHLRTYMTAVGVP